MDFKLSSTLRRAASAHLLRLSIAGAFALAAVGCGEADAPSSAQSLVLCDFAACDPTGLPSDVFSTSEPCAEPGVDHGYTCAIPAESESCAMVAYHCEDLTGCGAPGAGECGAGEYCDYGTASSCGATNEAGTCRPRPELCTFEYSPVCGCDGETYGNACAAAGAGMSVAHQGECASAGEVCGGFAGAECDGFEYCHYAIDAACGSADGQGECRPRPEACTEEWAPVCGCDGQTHSNGCHAALAGTSVMHDGECED